MREILFRAKRVDNGEWIEGCLVIRKDTGNNAINCYIIRPSYVHFNNSHIVHTEVDPETVSQFTGLLDKHGNKIFENDIVKCAIENPSTGKVEKYFNCVVTYCKTLNAMGWYGRDVRYVINKIPAQQEFLEIIGNRFD